ncbi:MAG: prepilin-type N-terminal cleavage/methylation domain-containing protein [Candidatus Sericytochromatia bacterium]|nr:prepilin-type N-terminal cleavage/methylation domain-containing protein [Candidatus Sericytochromatia bacterium]
MYIRKSKNNGFTIIELMVSILIISILIYAASSISSNLYADYIFKDFATRVEYQAKYAKIRAIQNSQYTGVCVNTTTKMITLRQMGANSSTPCDTSKPLLKTIDLSTTRNMNIGTSTNYIFDGRGLASTEGSVCIDNNKQYVKLLVGMTNFRTQKGDGVCP